MEFSSVQELYKRVGPALNSKVHELKKNNIDYVKKEDIWNYLIKKYWINSKGLELIDIVDDILNVPNDEIVSYVLDKVKNREESVDLEKLDI